MTFRPHILDRYLFREFVLSFVTVMAFCTLLMLVGSIFTKFSDIMEHDAAWLDVVMYFLTSLPGRLMVVVPIASMLAVLFSVGGLARTNEVLAMLTNGVHGLRLSVPIIFGGIIIVVTTFVMNEYVVPPLERLSRQYELILEEKDIESGQAAKSVFARGRDNWFYMCRVYTSRNKRMAKPTIVTLADDQTNLVQRIEASAAVLVKNDPQQKKSLWNVEAPRTWKLDGGQITTYSAINTSVTLALEEDLNKILSQRAKAEEMNFHQLRERIQILSAREQPVGALRTDLFRKITFPLGILVIMLIGFGYAVRARAGTAVAIFGYGIGWAVTYYLVNAVAQALGHSGSISPYSATVLPTIAFMVIAVVYLRRSYRWHT
ncbi:MAG: LptF/LptG family permease [Candidatus Sumerlaeaceae bacterium]